MKNRMWLLASVALLLALSAGRGSATAQGAHDLSGRWTLNRSLSQIPRDVGFNLVTVPSGTGAASSSDNASLAGALFRESEAEGRRREQLVDEVRSPSPRLTISEAGEAITFTDDNGRSRTLHATGREETLQLPNGAQVVAVTRWDGDRLEILYNVEARRQLRYMFWRTPGAPRLTAQVQFLEPRKGDTVTLVYEPTAADAPPPTTPAQAPAPAQQAPPSSPAAGSATLPSLAPPVARGPDAALKGLRRLGLVVEDFTQQETACGLKQAQMETTLSKALTDAGLQVIRNTDEDTYLYVHVMSATASNGLCVSRYDVYLYTHTMATLTYQAAPVLVQVELFHKGGMAGGAPAAHAESVNRGVKQYAEEIAGRVRDVNK